MEQMFTATGGPTDVLSGVICSGCRALTWNRCLQLLEDPQTCCLGYFVGAVGHSCQPTKNVLRTL